MKQFLLLVASSAVGLAFWMYQPVKRIVESHLEAQRANAINGVTKIWYRDLLKECDPNDPKSVAKFAADNPKIVEKFSEFGWENEEKLACFYGGLQATWGGYYWDSSEVLR